MASNLSTEDAKKQIAALKTDRQGVMQEIGLEETQTPVKDDDNASVTSTSRKAIASTAKAPCQIGASVTPQQRVADPRRSPLRHLSHHPFQQPVLTANFKNPFQQQSSSQQQVPSQQQTSRISQTRSSPSPQMSSFTAINTPHPHSLKPPKSFKNTFIPIRSQDFLPRHDDGQDLEFPDDSPGTARVKTMSDKELNAEIERLFHQQRERDISEGTIIPTHANNSLNAYMTFKGTERLYRDLTRRTNEKLKSHNLSPDNTDGFNQARFGNKPFQQQGSSSGTTTEMLNPNAIDFNMARQKN